MAPNDIQMSAFSQHAPFFAQNSWLGGLLEQVNLPRMMRSWAEAFPQLQHHRRHLPQPLACAEGDTGVLPASHDPMVKAVVLEGRREQGWKCSFRVDTHYIWASESHTSTANTPAIVLLVLCLAVDYQN